MFWALQKKKSPKEQFKINIEDPLYRPEVQAR